MIKKGQEPMTNEEIRKGRHEAPFILSTGKGKKKRKTRLSLGKKTAELLFQMHPFQPKKERQKESLVGWGCRTGSGRGDGNQDGGRKTELVREGQGEKKKMRDHVKKERPS